MAAEVVARLESRPELRVVQELVIAGAQALQFGPVVDCPFMKPFA